MIGYTLKPILELIPEVLPLVKSASVEEEYPVSNRDNCLASALTINYKKHFTSDVVDFDVLEKVAEATALYGIGELVIKFTDRMLDRTSSALVKQAGVETEGTFLTKQANWEGDFSGLAVNPREMSERAEELFEKAASLGATASDKVNLYSGNGFLDKERVLVSLGARFSKTNDSAFVKIASAVGMEGDVISSTKTVRSLCSVVTRLDEKHNLFSLGHDFYKEAMILKEAGFTKCMVKIAGGSYSLDRVLGIPGGYLDGYMGSGFSKELSNDPNSAKYMIESLPADSQQILASILKNA